MSLSRLSVELIPRSTEALLDDVASVKALFPAADTLNVPDLMRFPLRSWDAAALIRPHFARVVPHIRAIDIAPDAPLPGADQPGLEEVLVVHGDPPADLSHRTYPNSTESIIRRYKRKRLTCAFMRHLILTAVRHGRNWKTLPARKRPGRKGSSPNPCLT